MPGVTTAYQNGIHSARPAANSGCILYACSTHSLIYRSDGSAWTTWMTIGSTTTTVASDAIWDAAGDLAVGTGADTAAKLSIGAAGGALSVINGGAAWNSGTSFPGSKATGDRFYRTDLGTEYRWDGTQWVSMDLRTVTLSNLDSLQPSSTSGAIVLFAPVLASPATMYLVDLIAGGIVTGSNDGSNFWTQTLKYKDSANATQALTGTIAVSTSADGAGTVDVIHAVAANQVLNSGAKALILVLTKTGTPSGGVYSWAQVTYRHIAT